ncbi:MAG: stage IV sporulation protein A [Clostridia bacterium]|nr:stage IV sporulation protein A [Clostridia bacterium]
MSIYQDIAERTEGNIYVGVVGPVRTGKSTFIKRFMDSLVLPNIANAYQRERARDELPQSAGGRTIMTTEPKFVPNEAVEINLGDNSVFQVRLIDCVGYIVDSALGHIENDQPRMVSTPWYEAPIPFAQAAELGTKKVICEHSTIGLMVTTDGSISEIPRQDYVEAEQRVVSELQKIKKPFVILLNSTHPEHPQTLELKEELEQQYHTPVLPINCATMELEDIHTIMKTVLFEFPVVEISFYFPKWVECLEADHPIKQGLYQSVTEAIESATKISDVYQSVDQLKSCEYLKDISVSRADLANGRIGAAAVTREDLFYQVLSERSGMEIMDEYSLLQMMGTLSETKRKYDKVAYALEEVNRTGYGIVFPSMEELSLEEPEIVRQGTRFGVRLRAEAPSIHMIRANIETEVSPIVGTERQSEEMVQSMLQEFEVDPQKIWESNIFGKSLHELVNEGLQNKLSRMPEDARGKLQETLQKIINEGNGGLICIIL